MPACMQSTPNRQTPHSRGCVEKRWDYGLSEEPQHNRFLRQRQLILICHPVEGELTVAVSRSKMGGFLACVTRHELLTLVR